MEGVGTREWSLTYAPHMTTVPSLLRTLRLPMVRLFTDDDQRSLTRRLRLPLLLPLLARRQDIGLHRPLRLFGHRERFRERFDAVCVLAGAHGR